MQSSVFSAPERPKTSRGRRQSEPRSGGAQTSVSQEDSSLRSGRPRTGYKHRRASRCGNVQPPQETDPELVSADPELASADPELAPTDPELASAGRELHSPRLLNPRVSPNSVEHQTQPAELTREKTKFQELSSYLQKMPDRTSPVKTRTDSVSLGSNYDPVVNLPQSRPTSASVFSRYNVLPQIGDRRTPAYFPYSKHNIEDENEPVDYERYEILQETSDYNERYEALVQDSEDTSDYNENLLQHQEISTQFSAKTSLSSSESSEKHYAEMTDNFQNRDFLTDETDHSPVTADDYAGQEQPDVLKVDGNVSNIDSDDSILPLEEQDDASQQALLAGYHGDQGLQQDSAISFTRCESSMSVANGETIVDFPPLQRIISLPPEPKSSDEKILLAIKLPNGRRIQRFFRLTNTWRVVLQFAEYEAQLDFSGCHLVYHEETRNTIENLTLRILDTPVKDRTVLHIEIPD